MEEAGRYADINGLRMYYELHGAGSALLMLNGGTCSIELPSMGIPFFAGDFQVIALEQMGHGRTMDAIDRDFHYHDMADDALTLMDRLGIERASVFGLSDGGMVGLDMAVHHPERVVKLVMTGSNFRTDAYSGNTLEWLTTVKPEDWPADFIATYERLSPDGPGHWPIMLERLQRMWATEPDYSLEQLAGITAPTLVISGDRDVITPEHSVAMFRAIPGARLCIVPDAGHGVMPHETILSFLLEAPAGT